MSNYRVRQVLALPKMPENQLRLLLALATHLDDDSTSIRLGFQTLVRESGNVRNTVKAARRELEAQGKLKSTGGGRGPGDTPLWTVLCLPDKGGSDVDPLTPSDHPRKGVNVLDPLTDTPKGGSDVDPHNQGAKGVNSPRKRGSTHFEKGGQPEPPDLQKSDALLYRPAKSSCSPSLFAHAHAGDDDSQGEEREGGVIDEKIVKPGGAAPLAKRIVAAVPGATLDDAEALIAMARRKPGVRHPSAWLQTAIDNGTIADLMADEAASAVHTAELFGAMSVASAAPPPAPQPRPPIQVVQTPSTPQWKTAKCPVCEAGPDQFCRRPGTADVTSTHKERLRVARDSPTEAAS